MLKILLKTIYASMLICFYGILLIIFLDITVKNSKGTREQFENSTAKLTHEISVKKSFAAAICFALVSAFIMLFHEMWRDEYQAWQIASFSKSFSELFHNIRYEGHPAMWFVLLHIFSFISDSPVTMQIVHLVISTATVFIIFRFAPFTFIEKILLVGGYFFLYEYNIISRNYAISVLLIALICIQLSRLKFNGLLTGVLLFLLCNTNLYGGIIAAVFGFYLLAGMIINNKLSKNNFDIWISLFFLLAGLILLYFQLDPASHVKANDYYKWENGFSINRILAVGGEFFDVLFPVPSLDVKNSFGKNLVDGALLIKTLIVLVPFLITLNSLKRNKRLLLTYVFGSIVLFTILYFNQHTSLRHEGFLFILYVLIMWIALDQNAISWKNNITGKRVFTFLLIIQCAGGILAAGKDVVYPFSNIGEAGKFALKEGYDKIPVSGIADYLVSPFSTFTRKPIFTAERKEEIYFITWDDNRKEDNAAVSLLFNHSDSLLNNGHKKALVIMTQPFMDNNGSIVTAAPLNKFSGFTLVKKFDKPTIIGDENYYFYEISKLDSTK
jgi:hypothetical protein